MKLANNLTFESTLAKLESAYDCKYEKEQLDTLRLGFENGVDIHKYANPKLDWTYMNCIRKALEQDIDISKYIKPDHVPQVVSVMYVVAVNCGGIEQFVEHGELNFGDILEEYNLQRRIQNREPLEDFIQEAILTLGPYYVNE